MSRLWLLLGLSLVFSTAIVRAEEPPLAPERLDDPPGPHSPRDDPSARSPGRRVVFGPYVSVQVNVDELGQNVVGDAANEPSIAVSPTDPHNMVIGWRQFDTISSNFRQAGWGYTFDGGASWTFPGVLEPGVFRSDPVLDADSDGDFYYQSLKSSFLADVYKSTAGGQSWLAPVPAFGGDKNWLAVDRSRGAGDGQVYGIWQRFASCCGSNIFTRSTDGGASFEPPVQVPFSPFFGTLAVGPDGEVYATGADGSEFQDLDHFVVSRSTNAENPAAPPTFDGAVVPLGGRMGLGGAPNPGGLLGQANVAVDRSAGPTRGNVYVVASVIPPQSSDPLDVHFVRSTNGGASWSAPVRVNDDEQAVNWQWFAAHSVGPDGRIDVIWNDTRNSGDPAVSQLFYAYSYDAGLHWSANVPVSPPFNSLVGWPQQSKIGDYYSIVSNASGADVAYAATFNGEQDVYYLRAFPDCNANGISDVTDIANGSTDCNGNHIPDECQPAAACLGAGTVPDGHFIAGTELTVGHAAGGDLRLSWGKSCLVVDPDYAIYEGTLGDFTSHAARFCTTGGQKSKVLTPAAGSSYYLVVATHAGREGSYGKNSAGVERPPGAPACFPQQIRPCFAGP